MVKFILTDKSANSKELLIGLTNYKKNYKINNFKNPKIKIKLEK